MKRILQIYCRLMKYGLFMGALGGIASFVGEPGHALIKAGIGVTLGAMLLGPRLPAALAALLAEISSE